MVVWRCATANTKPRFQPSDDAEDCLYVKFPACAGLTTKTSTAHNSRENFAICSLLMRALQDDDDDRGNRHGQDYGDSGFGNEVDFGHCSLTPSVSLSFLDIRFCAI